MRTVVDVQTGEITNYYDGEVEINTTPTESSNTAPQDGAPQ